MRAIFGVDPGLHVGLLWFRLDTGEMALGEAPPLGAAAWITQRVREGDIISCERFTQNTRVKTGQNDALEVIGMCRLVAFRARATFLLNGASDATKVAPKEVLRALGWWRRGDADHVRRAAAQAALVYAQTWPDEFERRTGPGIVI
jgi:hypothetical protein